MTQLKGTLTLPQGQRVPVAPRPVINADLTETPSDRIATATFRGKVFSSEGKTALIDLARRLSQAGADGELQVTETSSRRDGERFLSNYTLDLGRLCCR